MAFGRGGGGDRRRQLALLAFRGLAYVWPGSNAPHVVVAVRDSQRQAWNIAVKIAGIGGAGWT